jgi:hypothetical protein
LAIVAIVIAVVSYSSSAPMTVYIIAGAIGGLIGGFVGGYIVTGTLKGAVTGGIQGALIGACIGYGAGAAAGAGTAVGAEGVIGGGGGTATSTCTGTTAAGEAFTATAGQSIAAGSTISSGTAVSYAGTSTAVTAAASVAANIYTASENQKDLGAAMSAFSKSLNDFPEYERYREGVFLNALSMTVDDPNTQKDTGDVDDDGNTDEMVSDFLVWWKNERYPTVSNCISRTTALTEAYINELKSFRDTLGPFISQLDRYEIECVCQSPAGSEGTALKLWRDLQGCGYDAIDFFEPGPDQTSLLNWYQDSSCDSCESTTPSGYDQIDASRYQLEEFMQTTRQLIYKDPAQLDMSYNDWIGILVADGETDYAWYDSECGPAGSSDDEDDGLVNSLNDVKEAIGGSDGSGGWINKTWEARNDVPRCALTNVAGAEEYELEISPPVNCSPNASDASSSSPSVSPCHWQKQTSANTTGAYFSNYPCRIKSPAYGDATDEGAEILVQINNVRAAVLTIEQDVKDDHPAPANAKNVKYTVNISSVSLTGTVLTKCSTESGAGENATLAYSGTATLEYDTEETVYTCSDGSQVSQGQKCPDGSDPDESTSTTHHVENYTLDAVPIIVANAGGLTITSMTLAQFNEMLNSFEAKVSAYADPFIPVINTMDTNWHMIDTFVTDTNSYVAAMKSAHRDFAHNGEDYPNGCYGPPTYSWTDSRGDHSVTVSCGPFKVPRTKKTKHGNWLKGKKCVNLMCYDDYNRGTWIKVVRTDETNKQVTSRSGNVFNQFFWNPSANRGTITKRARATWNGAVNSEKLELY